MKKALPEAGIVCIDGDLQASSIARGKAGRNDAEVLSGGVICY